MPRFFPLLLVCLLAFAACKDNAPTQDTGEGAPQPPTATAVTTPIISYSVVTQHPHDPSLFTEGLLVHEGKLFESTGSPEDQPETRSLIGMLDLNTGKLAEKVELDKTKYFGEGIVIVGDKLYQLTYKNQMGFIYDAKTFKQTGTFNYSNKEGWGMTTNGREIIMSDGTSTLTFLNPDNQQPVKTLRVTEQGTPVERLNELEYIKGFIYANVWPSTAVVKIDPSSGAVVGRLDLNNLFYEAQRKNPEVDVPNGIAYDSTTNKIFVTGKLWPNVYQIDFAH